MKKWFKSNKGCPYASKETKTSLAIEANVSFYQVSRWLDNKRKNYKAKKKRSLEEIEKRRLSAKLKKHLGRFFGTNPNPNMNELKMLSENYGSSLIKIQRWFANERYLKKKIHS